MMFAIGNEELECRPDIGKTILCPHCGKRHKVRYGDEIMKDGTKKPSDLLSFYKCGENIYLGAIKGKSID